MNWLESLLYGLISGFTRFIPISSSAHQAIFCTIFGFENADPLQNLLVDIALLASLITVFKPYFDKIRSRGSALRTRRNYSNENSGDVSLTRNALLPMLIVSLVLYYIINSNTSLLLVSAGLLLNGIILFLPSRLLQGNKDGRSMTLLDSIIIGTLSALSAIPGISGIGCAVSSAKMRGADSKKALHWAATLSITMLVIKLLVDCALILSAAGAGYIDFRFFGYLFSVIGAYIGGYIAIIMISRLITMRSTLSGFAYYSWGAALFSFILFLSIA